MKKIIIYFFLLLIISNENCADTIPALDDAIRLNIEVDKEKLSGKKKYHETIEKFISDLELYSADERSLSHLASAYNKILNHHDSIKRSKKIIECLKNKDL